MQKRRSFRGLGILIAGAIALVLAGTAVGQQQQQQREPSPLEREFMELQQRLTETQQTVFERNPGLVEQAQEIEDLVTTKMREAGYNPGALMETLLTAQGRLQDERLTDAQRREIVQSPEVVDAQRKLQEAQQQVMQDPEVIASQESFQEGVVEAMRRVDPETDRVIERLQEIQREVQAGAR